MLELRGQFLVVRLCFYDANSIAFSGIENVQDYEYASYNPVAYDVANHFCEMAANYHTETPHILDYTKYPGQSMFLCLN